MRLLFLALTDCPRACFIIRSPTFSLLLNLLVSVLSCDIRAVSALYLNVHFVSMSRLYFTVTS